MESRQPIIQNLTEKYRGDYHESFNNGKVSKNGSLKSQSDSISALMQKFLDYAQFEEDKMISTIEKYRDCLRACIKHVGDLDVEEVNSETLIRLRKQLRQTGIKERREASILNTLRVFLRYCQDQLGLEVIDYKSVKPPKAPKRVPEYLTAEEIKNFVKVINLQLQN